MEKGEEILTLQGTLKILYFACRVFLSAKFEMYKTLTLLILVFWDVIMCSGVRVKSYDVSKHCSAFVFLHNP